MNSRVSRRDFLAGSASFVSVLAALHARQSIAVSRESRSIAGPYGPLRPVADLETGLTLLLLPAGFEYRSFSWSGDPMANGERTPDAHDGMGVIAAQGRGTKREITLVRNHERDTERPFVAPARYDTGITKGGQQGPGGGTTTLVFRDHRWISAEPSLSGTVYNCSGGVTPWGTWLSCEESYEDYRPHGGRRHGYVFEVRRNAAETTGRPIVDMGRMQHEAVAIDPETRIAYLTEDDALRSVGFYRFIPKDRSGTAGSYEAGGQLQAARVIGRIHADLRTPTVGELHHIEWVDIEDPDADPGLATLEITAKVSGPFRQAWANGALRMSRGEGVDQHGGKIYVVDTSAGVDLIGRRGRGNGAVWEYDPRKETLRAVFVAGSQQVGDNIDNIAVSPRGGILLCEDGDSVIDGYGPGTRLLGLSAAGDSYPFAKNAVSLTHAQIGAAGKRIAPGDYRGEEVAGFCFDPAGEFAFMNIQRPGITVAIWGPWERGNL